MAEAGMMRRGLVALCAVAFLAATGGCVNVSSYAFRKDYRLHFTAPRNRAFVTLPLTLKWSIDRFQVAPAGSGPPRRDVGYFAVFVDASPIKPGATMREVAQGDGSCLAQPSCPDAQYLHDRQVYTTTDSSLVLQTVQPPAVHERTELHEVVIILMDTRGRRIGEAAWYLQFRMRGRKIL
jgi:hypothetical protein